MGSSLTTVHSTLSQLLSGKFYFGFFLIDIIFSDTPVEVILYPFIHSFSNVLKLFGIPVVIKKIVTSFVVMAQSLLVARGRFQFLSCLDCVKIHFPDSYFVPIEIVEGVRYKKKRFYSFVLSFIHSFVYLPPRKLNDCFINFLGFQ